MFTIYRQYARIRRKLKMSRVKHGKDHLNNRIFSVLITPAYWNVQNLWITTRRMRQKRCTLLALPDCVLFCSTSVQYAARCFWTVRRPHFNYTILKNSVLLKQKKKLIYRFQIFRLQCVNRVRNIQTSNKINFNIYDVFYSQYSHQQVSVDVPAIFRVMLLLPQYKIRVVISCVVYRLEQFQPVCYTFHTSPTTSSNQYTTHSTHHLQPVPTSIPHIPHITYNQFQPVYHTFHTSPTTSSNRYTTQLTSSLPLYCGNNNITLKMAGTPTETSWWEYCE